MPVLPGSRLDAARRDVLPWDYSVV